MKLHLLKSITTIFMVALMSGCCEFFPDLCEDPSISVRGLVLDYDMNPINEADVVVYYTVDGQILKVEGSTNTEGNFDLKVDKSVKYTLNISKKGFGFASAIFQNENGLDSIPEDTYYLNKATVVTIDATAGGTVSVTNTQSRGSASSQADWTELPTGTLPMVLDDSGRVASFSMPAALKDVWDAQMKKQMNLSATRVRIPGNALVNRSGSPAQGNVQVAISAIDIFAPGGMPGNDIARNSNRQSGTMVSYGAISIDVFDEEQSYNLNESDKITAEMVMPIPTWRLELQQEFPRTVPLLYFDEETGIWNEEGTAVLDDSLMVYRAELAHFSSINMDIIKSDPSTSALFTYGQTCPTVTNEEIETPIQIELVTRVGTDAPIFRYRNLTSTYDCAAPMSTDPCFISTFGSTHKYAFSLNRLPVDAPSAVTLFDGDVARALFVFNTPATGNQLITDGGGATPNCAEMIAHIDGSSPYLGATGPNGDIIFPTTAIDPIAAICWDGSNYMLSVASTDPAFDPVTNGWSIVFNGTLNGFESANYVDSPTNCSSSTFFLSDADKFEPFDNFSTTDPTSTPPGAVATWNVQVYKVLTTVDNPSGIDMSAFCYYADCDHDSNAGTPDVPCYVHPDIDADNTLDIRLFELTLNSDPTPVTVNVAECGFTTP
ncbi:hypothetical protein [Reichenbachiella sp.]|uniref:hypothetical protein n=1 Tax=Reichenbachiella sp. TaxID=2184521 RepID=UPI003BB12C08